VARFDKPNGTVRTKPAFAWATYVAPPLVATVVVTLLDLRIVAVAVLGAAVIVYVPVWFLFVWPRLWRRRRGVVRGDDTGL
jgi:hypothetical protein